ncbi:winged helix-turn-helix transcriptional regulator [Acinetobacter sp. DSM 11652]|uniref:winged helix-turn-helix transcriptional regulator n=1 Tax=Acinetobacter sp. DSM 11652 TaxID=346222 RepID=UPI0008AC24C0|nr:helix-turn-helix domain-containing protein [Acinetobacter sp. DSM 11652]SEL47189.1 DNA-binding transcriptional regulator, HxlR family [Acinetobacter sp. DSM 11652]
MADFMKENAETLSEDDQCNLMFIVALKNAMNVINGKWKLAIVATMIKQPRRFNEIERLLQGITPRMISKELKELELNNVVEKIESVDEITGKTTSMYDLTPSGRKLEKLMVQMAVWGQEHREA